MQPARAWYRDLCLVAFTSLGYGLPFALALAIGTNALVRGVMGALAEVVVGVLGLAGLGLAVVAVAKLYRHVRANGHGRLRVAYEALVLGWFPAWGLIVNHVMLSGRCVRDGCGADMHRPFNEPWVIAPALLHAATALAFALSRRRPARLRPAAETVVLAAMLVGVVLHLTLAAQIGPTFMAVGLADDLLGSPSSRRSSPSPSTRELRDRLRRRGAEEGERTETVGAGAYRVGEVSGLPPPAPSLSTRWLARALAASPALLGAYAVLSALVTHRAMAGVLAFTQTCDHTFSRSSRRLA